jgi:hypothetical protein
VRVTVLVNGVAQRAEGETSDEDATEPSAESAEAPLFEGDFQLVGGDDGELELDSDVEDGGTQRISFHGSAASSDSAVASRRGRQL